jgi:hypothetical protein
VFSPNFQCKVSDTFAEAAELGPFQRFLHLVFYKKKTTEVLVEGSWFKLVAALALALQQSSLRP